MTSNEYMRGGRRGGRGGEEGRVGYRGITEEIQHAPQDVQIPLPYILLSSRIT